MQVATDTPVKLNLGAGTVEIEGFTPIDRLLGTEVYPLEYADDSVDEIRASHVLEHFGFEDAHQALTEWARVLKPGGKIRIAVPDFDWVAENRDKDPKARFYIMGGQTDENDFHRSLWTEPALRDAMTAAGIGGIERWKSDNTDCASLPCSLNLEGCKETQAERGKRSITIAAMMTVPRLGFNCNTASTANALKPFGIPLRTSDGVFWGQCLQRMFEDAIAEGLDWILAIDYDSMFTARHLDDLLCTFGKRSDIDALCALQVKRGQEYPLMTVSGDKVREVDGSPIQIRTAHFGLTLIRVAALKEIPLPLFKATPDENGQWTDKRIDDDIHFWKSWEKAGKTVFVDPQVPIGHIEMMVSEFDHDMKVQHTHVPEWRAREKKREDSSVRKSVAKPPQG